MQDNKEEGKKSIGAEPATSVNNGQDPNNTPIDSAKKEQSTQHIPASNSEYANRGKATQAAEADRGLAKEGLDDEDRADLNSLKGIMENPPKQTD